MYPPQRPFLLEVTECASYIFNVTFTVITSLLCISFSTWLCQVASYAIRALVWVASISCSLIFTWRKFSPKSWSCGWFLITFSLLLPESSTASWLAGLYLSPAAKFSEFSFHPPGSRPSRWQSVGLSVDVSPGDEIALFLSPVLYLPALPAVTSHATFLTCPGLTYLSAAVLPICGRLLQCLFWKFSLLGDLQ